MIFYINKSSCNEEVLYISSNENKKLPFLVAFSYLCSLLFIRTMVIIAKSANSSIAQVVKEGNANFRFYIGRNIILFGYHIHHFYFGILLIAISGWFAIMGNPILSKEKLALLYGAGLGLLMDEIGLLLTWGQYYTNLTYILSVVLLGFFLNIIYFPSFWKQVRNKVVKNTVNVYIWKKFIGLIVVTADFLSRLAAEKEIIYLIFIVIFCISIGIILF